MDDTAVYLSKNTESWVIDNKLIKKLEDETSSIETGELDDETKKIQKEYKMRILKVMHALQTYAQEKKIKCDFIILKVSQFSSGFGKPDFFNINIVFRTPTGDKVDTVGDIVSSLQARDRKSHRDIFFYLFYERDPDTKQIDNQEFCEILFKKIGFS